MPPKSSSRLRKKAVPVVDVPKNGSNGVADKYKGDDALEGDREIKGTKMSAKDVNKVDKSKDADPLNGETETNAKDQVEEIPVSRRGRKKAEVKIAADNDAEDKTESEIFDKNGEAQNTKKDEANIISKRGRKKIDDKESKDADPLNGETETSAKDQVAEIPVSRRGRKKAEVKIAADNDAEDKTESEISDENGEAQNTKKDEANIMSKRGRKKVDDKSAEDMAETVVSKDAADNIPDSEDKESEKEDNASAKRGRRKLTKAEDSLPSEDKNQEDANKKDATTRGRTRKLVTETEPKQEVPIAGRMRKRKMDAKEDKDQEDKTTNTKENVKSMSRGRKKKNVEEKPEVQGGESRQLMVALKRDKSLDDLAKAERKSVEEESKITSAKGSESVAKGKRAAEGAEESKPAKKLKETSSKPKKDKIPDVTALDFDNTSKTPDGKEWNLKISSWNVNGIRAWLEKDGLTYLHHEKPDVMCIQETKCSDDKLPAELSQVDGYHCHWLAGDKDGYSGVGLLSKEKPVSIQYGIGVAEHDSEGRAITAEYDSFYLVTTYVPNAGRGLVRLDYRMTWDLAFQKYLKELDAKKPVVLCGDLNVAHEEIDLANPKSNKKNAGFTKEERESFASLLSEGFVDSFRHLYPDQKDAYTFWTYMMNARVKNVGWRLDYFVLSKKFCDQLCDSVIRKEVFGSDHCPVTLFLHV